MAQIVHPELLPNSVLPPGIRSRFVHGVNGLRVHVLEAGFANGERPMVLLLHGFPELAFSWRKIMVPLATAGYHVVAPDQRGYGRTTGWDCAYDGDLDTFRLLNIATDALALVSRLGRRSVAAVVGHDFGSPVAARCALARPDVFPAVVMMSAPFAGLPALPSEAVSGARQAAASIHRDLASLVRPRKHYALYYSTREANADMLDCPQGVQAFLRAYYHVKSAAWTGNRPHPLQGWTATELAKLPTYYVMNQSEDMAATVAPEMPSADQIARCAWLTDAELAVYAEEFRRTGFQGGLQWYRGQVDGRNACERIFAGRTLDAPSAFVAGRSDWGIYQRPGDFEAMQSKVCTQFRGVRLIDDAGHWVQQEQPEEVARLLLEFLAGL